MWRFRAVNGSGRRRALRETIALSDNSPERAGWWWNESSQIAYWHNAFSAGGLRQLFPILILSWPYCTDYIEQGLRIRLRDLALRRQHIQLNGPRASGHRNDRCAVCSAKSGEGHAGAAEWLEATRLRIDCGVSQHMRKHIAVMRADRLPSATLFRQPAKRNSGS